MKTRIWIVTWVMGLLASLLLASCGSSSNNTSPPPTVSISVSPTTASVQTGATQQFTATVTGTSNTAVTWQVNSVAGGNSTVGTISAAGLYTAPAAVPNPAAVTVTATSSADSTKTASATVTVTAPPAVAVTLTPPQAVVQLGMTQQFTGSATGGNGVTTVTYSLSGGTGDLGTISAAGLYTAPATMPSSPIVTLTATADADNTTTNTATITLTAASTSNATLNGTYAFRLRGEDNNGYFQAVGNMTFDGAGNVTGGE